MLQNNTNLFIIIFGRIAQVVISILTIRIMTEYLSPFEFGRLGIILTISILIISLMVTPVGMYINRHLIIWNEQGKLKLHLYYLSLYTISISIVSSLVILIINYYIGISIQIFWLWLIILLLLYIKTYIANTTMLSSLNLLGHRISFVSLTLITSITSLLFSLLLIKIYKPNMEFWLLGQVLGFGLIALLSWHILSQKLNQNNNIIKYAIPKINYKLIYPIIFFALPLAMATGFNWIQLQSFKFILANSGGLEVLGLFIAGYGISAAILTVFDNIMTQYYLPVFYSNIADANNKQISNALHQYLMLLMPTLIITVIFIIFASPYLVKLLLSDSFQSAQQFVIWGALTECLRVIAYCISMGAHATKNTQVLILPNLIGAGSVITILLFSMTYVEPGVATGIGLVAGGLIFILTLYFYINQNIRLFINFKPIINALLLAIPIMVMFILSTTLITKINIFLSILVLSIIGIYYVFAQFIIYKQWSKNQ